MVAVYASIGVIAAAMVAVLFAGNRRGLAHALTLAALAAALTLTASAWYRGQTRPGGAVADCFPLAVATVALVDVIIAVVGFRGPAGEYKYESGAYILALAGAMGLLGVAWSGNMLTLFTSWTLFSVSSYALIAVPRDSYSASGAVKYGLMSLAASNLLLLSLGVASLETKTLALTESARIPLVIALGATALLLAALGFKIGVFPFHAWLPDAYGYSDPLPVSVVAPLSKAATILAVYKLSPLLAPQITDKWLALLGLFALLTMTYGNITALLQRGLQSLLAFSSIAQAGYLLVGLAALAVPEAKRVALYGLALQLLAYSLAKTGLFLLARAIRRYGDEPPTLDGLRGLAQANPALAASTAILVLSLMGMPPLAGFWGKLYLFLAPVYVAPWLTALALINTGIAAAYYARLVKAVYFEPGSTKLQGYRATTLAVEACAALTLASGVIPLFLQP
ncbi:hypothetical protein IG193_02290 [Infirmifilum lucidum]|uniref:NADH:quinone oxidoreductase/Mrp antiporter transmembrane domain-containing protein n=1 Tax=Infirmifilum lucidum TaxID=2776706 RepID=A0A7L9FK46_9CREN|nr:proton-conducting transporter membrane subunit [Infirmifilum lucidum]QOJ79314.1 hypothetical protein IG193_02290 [Infirmifilum lucidum]